MAIQKNHELDSGVVAKYWRVVFTGFNWEQNEGRIMLVAHLNRAARDSGKKQIHGAEASISLGPDEMAAIEKITNNEMTADAIGYKQVSKKAAYIFLRNQQKKNPAYTEGSEEPELIPGAFAGEDSSDV